MLTTNLLLCFGAFFIQVFCLDDVLKNSLLNGHNEYRRTIALGKGGQTTASNMRELTWDADLEAKAQEHANRCTVNHDTYTDRRTLTFKMVGQNTCLSPDENVCQSLWYAEKDNYQFPTQQCKGVCGHYTQMVWASTYKMGCGKASCNGLISLVCNYGPAGNEQGADPYTEGFPAAECPPGTTKNNGLCS